MKRQNKQIYFYPLRFTNVILSESVITWGLPLAFCVHLLDEFFLNGGFVAGVQQHIWPAYNYNKFGPVNAAFILLISGSSFLYHKQPEKWIFLPLFWLWERSWNGVWHILWTITWNEYSPGLGTSGLFGGLLLIMLRKTATGKSSVHTVILSSITGLSFEVFLVSTLFIFR